MIEIKKLENATCIELLDGMFTNFGIAPLNPLKKMLYWAVTEEALLDTPILSKDEEGNEVRTVFFITRKRKKNSKLEILRLTEVFVSLHETEKDTSIQEALEMFLESQEKYMRPVAVISLGTLSEDGEKYSGAFLYNISPVEICIEAEVPQVDIPDEND